MTDDVIALPMSIFMIVVVIVLRLVSDVGILFWVCTLRGKRPNYRTSVMVLHLNQSPLMDTLWRSLASLSTWAALLTPLVTLILTFFDESALHHQ